MKIVPVKLTMQETSEMSNESPPVMYDAIAAGHLKTFLVGRRRFARPEDVKAWVDYLQAESDAGRPVSYRSRAAMADKRSRAAMADKRDREAAA